MPELLFWLFSSISFHTKTWRFKAASTAWCWWRSFDDSNVNWLLVSSAGPVIVNGVSVSSSQFWYDQRHKTRFLDESLYLRLVLAEEQALQQRSCMKTMVSSVAENEHWPSFCGVRKLSSYTKNTCIYIFYN